MPPPVSPSTEPPRRTKFGMMANGPIVEEKDAGEEEESGDPYFKIVRIGGSVGGSGGSVGSVGSVTPSPK